MSLEQRQKNIGIPECSGGETVASVCSFTGGSTRAWRGRGKEILSVKDVVFTGQRRKILYMLGVKR